MSTHDAPLPGALTPPPKRGRLDRVLDAIPAIGLAFAVFTLYGIQAWSRKTPWVFTDELEWTQISRAIESTGHAARRGEPIYFKTIYAVLISPFWSIHSTEAAYTAIKYFNAFLMPLAALPTYKLSRLVLPKTSSVAVAVLAVAIPSMSYVTSMVPEVLAYPYYAFASWLIVRALISRKRNDIAIALVISLVALLVRSPQFDTIPASFAIAASWLWFTGPRGRALRSSWSRQDAIGAAVLFVGALFLFNRVVLQHIDIWQVSTQYWKDRMVRLGLWAGSAFAIGLGIGPIIAGFTGLRLPEQRENKAYRAFVAYAGSTIVCIALYTAVKAAFLSTVFSTLDEERNLFYLSPIFLILTALTLRSRVLDWRIVGAASAFCLYLIWGQAPELQYPYFEAPGMGVLTFGNRNLALNVVELRMVTTIVLLLALWVIVLRRYRAIVGVAAVFLVAWMLTSEITTTWGESHFGNAFRAHLPQDLSWIDHQSHGGPVTYLGQEIVDPNGLWLTEFWNRSITHVASLDGTAPGPGPTEAPTIRDIRGTLALKNDPAYIVTDNGIVLQADPVAKWHSLTLYQRTGPWRLAYSEQQVYPDGWAPGWSTYTYFGANGPGTMLVTLSRAGYKGNAKPGHATVKVGTIRIDLNQQSVLKNVVAVRHAMVRNGRTIVLRIHIPISPARVEVTITPTFQPSASDPRNLGAQVAFAFAPDAANVSATPGESAVPITEADAGSTSTTVPATTSATTTSAAPANTTTAAAATTTASTTSAPHAITLTTGEIMNLQRDLAQLGYYSYAVTGVYGPITTKAVQAFQRANGLSPAGTWDSASQAALDKRLGR